MAPADVGPPRAPRSPRAEQISATETHFLPDNPPPHLTPSLTHQPELLYMQGLLDSLANVVTQILNHPMIDSPVPDHTLFTDADAFRLYFQYHQSVTELARITMRLKRASRLLQFLPGPPGPKFTVFLSLRDKSLIVAGWKKHGGQSVHSKSNNRFHALEISFAQRIPLSL